MNSDEMMICDLAKVNFQKNSWEYKQILAIMKMNVAQTKTHILWDYFRD